MFLLQYMEKFSVKVEILVSMLFVIFAKKMKKKTENLSRIDQCIVFFRLNEKNTDND